MSTMKMTPFQLIGMILCRGVVPLWVLTGAIFKLTEKSPRLLPESIWSTAADFGINLYVLLAVLIAIEFAIVGVMFFIPRLARAAAIFMLAVFCIVLIVEMLRGSTSCGCLGGASPPPWLMLIIDGALLLGVVLFAPPRPKEPEVLPPKNMAVAAIWTAATLAVTAAMILPETRANEQVVATKLPQNGIEADPDKTDPDANNTTPPTQRTTSIPSLVTVKPANWIDKKWTDVEFSKYAQGWPADIADGRKYIIFYSRSCDHCQALLNYFFYDPPADTIIVAVPETKSGFDVENELPMQCANCIELELPVGTEWFLTPPLVVALEDGIVKCAAEGVDGESDEPECLLWH